eukprot:COSAG01_NODE_385_length_17743_cov_20.528622_4_plen_102_part_00
MARRRFLRLWPYLNAAYEGVYFVYQFLYLVERTDWYRLRHIISTIRTGIQNWLRFTYTLLRTGPLSCVTEQVLAGAAAAAAARRAPVSSGGVSIFSRSMFD